MDQQKAWLGRGWSYPVRIDPATGGVAYVEYETDIRQSILIILSTAPGERMMRPDFGCGIHDLAFEVINVATLTRIEATVTAAITKYEARIELLSVRADPLQPSDGLMLIDLEKSFSRTNTTCNLVYPFFFPWSGVVSVVG